MPAARRRAYSVRRGPHVQPLIQVIPFAAFALWLIVVVYVVLLATRLVKGVERIAGALERR